MELGVFSISLAVKDMQRSLAFYRTLGFEQIDGKVEQNWVILKNGDAKIGLFAGMFEDNLLTFHPADARAVEAKLREAGYAIDRPTADGKGPTSFAATDPDGNMMLFDQFGDTP